ncbi:MAG: hypothetical protein ABIZ04_18075 [Opitutus sp.]
MHPSPSLIVGFTLIGMTRLIALLVWFSEPRRSSSRTNRELLERIRREDALKQRVQSEADASIATVASVDAGRESELHILAPTSCVKFTWRTKQARIHRNGTPNRKNVNTPSCLKIPPR